MSKHGKDRIIEGAKKIISENGINGATIRGIAKEAGLSTGAIYHYYSSKEEILYDVMNVSLSVSTRISNELKEGVISRDQSIKEISENILKRFEKTDENRIQFYLAQEAILGEIQLREKFKGKYSEWIVHVEEILEKLYGKKKCRLTPAIASILIGAIDGLVLQNLLGVNEASTEEIVEAYDLMIREGIPKLLDIFTKPST
ncbi:TetR/AcrR family transcriptional regulator [Clostridium gasigenes]|uniref:TetR/AcrR family transcriptional regulator n=1 Tax=Clostridium gasigenes TaxID=94869 RepID=UPI001C0ACB48|nr:TetR/AcrR family transcriptional regulator [Clostridium gasigenes]